MGLTVTTRYGHLPLVERACLQVPSFDTDLFKTWLHYVADISPFATTYLTV